MKTKYLKIFGITAALSIGVAVVSQQTPQADSRLPANATLEPPLTLEQAAILEGFLNPKPPPLPRTQAELDQLALGRFIILYPNQWNQERRLQASPEQLAEEEQVAFKILNPHEALAAMEPAQLAELRRKEQELLEKMRGPSKVQPPGL